MRILIFFPTFFLLTPYFNGNNQKNDLRLEQAIPSFIQQDTVRLYFPLKEKGQDSVSNANALDTSKNIWYSKMLFALHEPHSCNL